MTAPSPIILQNVTDNTLTVNVNGAIQEIQNQLQALIDLVHSQQCQSFQYADKIYNIAHINEANFGLMTGQRGFNEILTKQLLTAIDGCSTPAQGLLQGIADKTEWERMAMESSAAKEIIAYSFVGVIGIQLSKLWAIGNESITPAKPGLYIQKCLDIAQHSLDVVCFALFSRWGDAQKQQTVMLTDTEKTILKGRLDSIYPPGIELQFKVLQTLYGLFHRSDLELPLPALNGMAGDLQDSSPFHMACMGLHGLVDKLYQQRHDLLDCYKAETCLADLLTSLSFLACYRMASIKQIGYHQVRNVETYYLHRYAALGIDSKANVDAEKINYTHLPTHTDAVLLYEGDDYKRNISLYPFVIDYNALCGEQGAKVCFYRTRDLADQQRLKFLFLMDNSAQYLEHKGIWEAFPNKNELFEQENNRTTLNLDRVVKQFMQARDYILGEQGSANPT
jgi:hypothetical protein